MVIMSAHRERNSCHVSVRRLTSDEFDLKPIVVGRWRLRVVGEEGQEFVNHAYRVNINGQVIGVKIVTC